MVIKSWRVTVVSIFEFSHNIKIIIILCKSIMVYILFIIMDTMTNKLYNTYLLNVKIVNSY